MDIQAVALFWFCAFFDMYNLSFDCISVICVFKVFTAAIYVWDRDL